MNEKSTSSEWISAAKARGWAESLRLCLDLIEPLAPIASQLLWVVQPTAGLFGAREAIGEIAEALDTPEGIEALRRELDKK